MAYGHCHVAVEEVCVAAHFFFSFEQLVPSGGWTGAAMFLPELGMVQGSLYALPAQGRFPNPPMGGGDFELAGLYLLQQTLQQLFSYFQGVLSLFFLKLCVLFYNQKGRVETKLGRDPAI